MNKNLSPSLLFLFFMWMLYVKTMLILSGLGFFDFLLTLAFIPIVVLVTVVALIINIKPKWQPKLFFLNLGIGAFTFVVYWFFIDREKIHKLDWDINKEKRETIIELIKEGKIKDEKIPDSLELRLNCSSDEFHIQTKTDSSLTVLFYTDYGLLDHYSAFIYSNDSNDLIQLNEQVRNGGNDYKINENWFEVND
jgi:hypothetical protein